jgi:hypothetical protein
MVWFQEAGLVFFSGHRFDERNCGETSHPPDATPESQQHVHDPPPLESRRRVLTLNASVSRWHSEKFYLL